MGARSAIVVRFHHDQRIHLYTHNGGRDVPRALQRGLARVLAEGRADDEAWVASVLLDELRAASPGWPGDWLVSPTPIQVDREYGEWHVDPERRLVQRVDAYLRWDGDRPEPVEQELGAPVTFEEVAAAPELPAFHGVPL